MHWSHRVILLSCCAVCVDALKIHTSISTWTHRLAELSLLAQWRHFLKDDHPETCLSNHIARCKQYPSNQTKHIRKCLASSKVTTDHSNHQGSPSNHLTLKHLEKREHILPYCSFWCNAELMIKFKMIKTSWRLIFSVFKASHKMFLFWFIHISHYLIAIFV